MSAPRVEQMPIPNLRPDKIDSENTQALISNLVPDEIDSLHDPDIDLIDEIEDLSLAACGQEDQYFDEDNDAVEIPIPEDGLGSVYIQEPRSFSHILHDLLDKLSVWSNTCTVGRDHGAFVALISDVKPNIHQIVDTYLQGKPQAVQALFEKPELVIR